MKQKRILFRIARLLTITAILIWFCLWHIVDELSIDSAMVFVVLYTCVSISVWVIAMGQYR